MKLLGVVFVLFAAVVLSEAGSETQTAVEPSWSNAVKKITPVKVEVPPIVTETQSLEAPPDPPTSNQDNLKASTSVSNAESPKSVAGSSEQKPAPQTSVQIIVAIPTMRRWNHDGTPAPVTYLTDLVNNIDGGMTEEQRSNVRYLLYNVDKEPEKHAEVKSLQQVYGSRMEVLVKTAKPKANMKEDNRDEKVTLHYTDGISREVSRQTADWISGETRDATNLLFDARKKAPYVMFLEDDVKPTANVISKINMYLEDLKAAKKDDWFMIDLYTPKISWGRNPNHVERLERYDYECCTQAMLFRSDRLLDVLLYETLHPNNPIDDNIRDFSREEGAENRAVYALVPNGFDHLGRYSSNPEKSSDHVEHQSINFVP